MQIIKIIVTLAAVAIGIILALFVLGCVALAIAGAEVQEEQRHWNDTDDRKAR